MQSRSSEWCLFSPEGQRREGISRGENQGIPKPVEMRKEPDSPKQPSEHASVGKESGSCPASSTAPMLREAVTDGYRRKGSKKARYRPANPDKKPLGQPQVRKLNPQEKKLERLAADPP